ncbi:MFS transporter [Sphingomonas sp. MA1305]|uniref:MFS transporter n=1 Tax=Sphingomonas sp. MA1305 TaxID=2479204 RepID=UPI002FCD2904
MALADAGGVIAYLPLLTLLLPIKVERLTGDARIGVFTATVVAGAIAASLANVTFGWLSDRSFARGHGRRRWMVAGVIVTAASYVGIAFATSPVALVAAIAAFQIAVNVLLAPMMAAIAEEVPDSQKGIVGGLFAFGGPLASAFSALLLGQVFLSEDMRFAILPVAVGLCIAPLLLSPARVAVDLDAPPGDGPPPRRELVVAGVARLLVQIAAVVTQAYLLYYFESIVPASGRAGLPTRIGHLLTIALIIPLPVALILGRVSDVTRRRKPAILAAAATAAAGLLAMALARDWTAGAIAFVVYMLGSAVFVALNAGIAMQLLPDPRRRGRDLGLLNLANTVPSLLGPPLAWLFATPQDFGGVMVALAVLVAGGGLTMMLVEGR